jgi:hypothetical protein
MQHPINARFWVWYAGDWVKLTLRPGDRRGLYHESLIKARTIPPGIDTPN